MKPATTTSTSSATSVNLQSHPTQPLNSARVRSSNTLQTAKVKSSTTLKKKKRTEVIIEPKRLSAATASQPLFLKQGSISQRGGKENTETQMITPRASAQSHIEKPICQNHQNSGKQAPPSKVAQKGLSELIAKRQGSSPKGASSSAAPFSKPNIPTGLPRPNKKSPPKKSELGQSAQIVETKTLNTMADDISQCTEPANFVSKKNPHQIVREIQKKERLFMFATYDYLADPAIFRQVLQQLPSQRTFPQEMCQLIIKDFELCFGKSQVDQDILTPTRRRINGHNIAVEYFNPEESPVPEEAPDVYPFSKKSKNKLLFVQAYLLPFKQLNELICYLTGINSIELEIPEKFSFKQPLKLMTPRNSFYNCLTKLAPFENLDVLCLTRDTILPGSVCSEGVIPPKSLLRSLFYTYSNVFRANQTEHTLLYYLYQLPQVSGTYQLTDLVHVVAQDLLTQAKNLKQEEPTIIDEHNQVQPYYSPQQVDYERIDSPKPAAANNRLGTGGTPFKISLLEMPLDPGSADKKDNNTQDLDANYHQKHARLANQFHRQSSASNLNNSYLVSNQKSRASINIHGDSRGQVQEALSIASEKKFGLGGNIVTGLNRFGGGRSGLGSFSRNSLTMSEANTVQSDLTQFGHCPFNASNLSLSVYGNNSIIGQQQTNQYGRGPNAMMKGLGNHSPKRIPLPENNYMSPYGRPSFEGNQNQANRRYTNKY